MFLIRKLKSSGHGLLKMDLQAISSQESLMTIMATFGLALTPESVVSPFKQILFLQIANFKSEIILLVMGCLAMKLLQVGFIKIMKVISILEQLAEKLFISILIN